MGVGLGCGLLRQEAYPQRLAPTVFREHLVEEPVGDGGKQNLQEGGAAVAEDSHAPQLIAADPDAFASLFNLQAKSAAAESRPPR